MNALKRRIRERDYQQAVAEKPSLAEEKKADDFPLPDDERAWEEYETLKFIYEEETREYQRQEKLALETFPNENKKVHLGSLSRRDEEIQARRGLVQRV